MFKTVTKWHKTSEELPERSCEVIAITEFSNGVSVCRYVHLVNYSHRWKKFNCCDITSESDARAWGFDGVVYWITADEILAAIEKSAEADEAATTD